MSLIVNIEKKMRNLGFTRFINNQLLDGDGNVIDSILDPGPGGNVAGTVVIAYASSPTGTGFTLTNNEALEYIAFKFFVEGATPVVSDFNGLWFHRKGLPGQDGSGTDGADGQAAGFRVTFDTSTVMDKPGTGKIRANNSNLALATQLALDELTPTSMDISGVINMLKDGMLFVLRPNANISDPMFVFELTADPIDNGDWFSLAVTNRAASNTTFSLNDACTYQFYGAGVAGGAVTEAAVLAAGNFTRFADNGASGYKMLDNSNVEVKSASQVFKLPGFTISGVSNIPAANTFPHGAVVRLHQDILVGVGANPMGVYVQADAINNIWRPFGRQILFDKFFGTIASPTVTLTAAGKFNLGGTDPIIPAGLLNSGSRLLIHSKVGKVGTTAPLIRMHLGTDMSARENNSMVYSQTFTATADLHTSINVRIELLSATTGKSSRASTWGGGGAASSFVDFSTLINVANDMKLTAEATTLAADTINVFDLMIVWEA